jgi:hypothetical protein
MFAKIWRTVREEVKANENEELVLELEHGQVPLSKIVEELSAYRAKEASKKEEETKEASKRVLNDDDEVEVDGKKMKVHELVAEYNKAKEAGMEKGEEKHEAADKEKMNEDMAMEQESKAMCDAADEVKDEMKKVEKKAENARFNSLKSAYENGSALKVEDQFVSTRERVDMGKARYGKK